MSKSDDADLAERLAALEKGSARQGGNAPRRSPLLALVVVLLVGLGGTILYLLAPVSYTHLTLPTTPYV